MPAPVTAEEFIDLTRKSGVVEEKRLGPALERLRDSGALPGDPKRLAGLLIRDGVLTHFQAEQLLLGKWRRFTIGKYKVLERLGSGGMGSVYLCEHKFMRRRVAVKVLPTAKAQDDKSSKERFYREAKAIAALDHPNIVHAYDIDQEDNLHFLVMEYIDGASLQEIVKKSGPLDPVRAAHYIHQACQGLAHAHAVGLVHRDVKPGNLLVDRQGVVKILDMGLARFFNDEEDMLTKKYDETVLGTADYLAPEQAVDSHEADTRADIYSLGATLYFLLTGKPPFEEGTVAQKLLWHQTRQPRPVQSFRADVPPEMVGILQRMMAKVPAERYQHPLEVCQALLPWVQRPIDPPPESEMPRLSPAAAGPQSMDLSRTSAAGLPPAAAPGPWQVSSPAAPHPQPVTPTPSPAARRPAAAHAAAHAPALPAPPRPAPRAPHPPAAAANGPAAPAHARPAPAPAGGDTELIGDPGELPGPPRPAAPPRPTAGTVWLVAGGGTVLLLIASFLVWTFVIGPAPPRGEPARRLVVSRAGGRPGTYPSIDRALRSARDGDVIELADPRHEESVVVDPQKYPATRVTIRAAPGASVTWAGRNDDPVLRLHAAAGFRLQGEGLTLDGQDRAPTLVLVSSRCPGAAVEGATLRGFTSEAVRVMNCAGEPGDPVRLTGLRVEAPAGRKVTGVLFDARPTIDPDHNDYVDVDRCDFAGVPEGHRVRRTGPAVTGPHIELPRGVAWEAQP